MMPYAGGEFVYLKEAYHPFWGYLFGWTQLSVIQTASLAAASVALATYLGYFVPLTPWAVKAVGIGVVLVLSALNCYGLKWGTKTQNFSTFLKLLLMVVMIILCLTLGREGGPNFHQRLPHQPGLTLPGRLGTAMVAALWAYDGWISITYVGGELKQPEKCLPSSIILSVLVGIGIALLGVPGYLFWTRQKKLAGVMR